MFSTYINIVFVGLALVDITYLFCVSIECYFVLHGTLWHDTPVVPPDELDEFCQNNALPISHTIKPTTAPSNHKWHSKNLNSYPWSKYQSMLTYLFLIFLSVNIFIM